MRPRSCLFFSGIHIPGRLQPEQMCIGATGGQKCLVRPVFNDFALLDHNDAVGHAHRREAMRNKQGCGTSGDLLKAAEDFCFGLGINR